MSLELLLASGSRPDLTGSNVYADPSTLLIAAVQQLRHAVKGCCSGPSDMV